MADPLTWTVVGSTVVVEGIKFLYGQMTEVMKRLAAKKEKPAEPATSPEPVALPTVFAQEGETRQANLATAEKLEEEMYQLHSDLAAYAAGLRKPTVGDPIVLEQLEALRKVMEAVYANHITFKGEKLPTSFDGPTVNADLRIKEVKGYVAGIRIKKMNSGNASAKLDIDKVETGATAIGVEIDELG